MIFISVYLYQLYINMKIFLIYTKWNKYNKSLCLNFYYVQRACTQGRKQKSWIEMMALFISYYFICYCYNVFTQLLKVRRQTGSGWTNIFSFNNITYEVQENKHQQQSQLSELQKYREIQVIFNSSNLPRKYFKEILILLLKSSMVPFVLTFFIYFPSDISFRWLFHLQQSKWLHF